MSTPVDISVLGVINKLKEFRTNFTDAADVGLALKLLETVCILAQGSHRP